MRATPNTRNVRHCAARLWAALAGGRLPGGRSCRSSQCGSRAEHIGSAKETVRPNQASNIHNRTTGNDGKGLAMWAAAAAARAAQRGRADLQRRPRQGAHAPLRARRRPRPRAGLRSLGLDRAHDRSPARKRCTGSPCRAPEARARVRRGGRPETHATCDGLRAGGRTGLDCPRFPTLFGVNRLRTWAVRGQEECLFDEIDSGTKVSGSFQVSTGGFLDIDAKVCALGRLCPARTRAVLNSALDGQG